MRTCLLSFSKWSNMFYIRRADANYLLDCHPKSRRFYDTVPRAPFNRDVLPTLLQFIYIYIYINISHIDDLDVLYMYDEFWLLVGTAMCSAGAKYNPFVSRSLILMTFSFKTVTFNSATYLQM